jgi:hypothetical protein
MSYELIIGKPRGLVLRPPAAKLPMDSPDDEVPRLRKAHLLQLAPDLPVLIEIVDKKKK